MSRASGKIDAKYHVSHQLKDPGVREPFERLFINSNEKFDLTITNIR